MVSVNELAKVFQTFADFAGKRTPITYGYLFLILGKMLETRSEGVHEAEIVKATQQPQMTVNRAFRKLREEGLIKVVKSDAHPFPNVLFLTVKGQELLDRLGNGEMT